MILVGDVESPMLAMSNAPRTRIIGAGHVKFIYHWNYNRLSYKIGHVFVNGALVWIVRLGPEAPLEGLGDQGKTKTLIANTLGVQVRFFHEDSYQSNKRNFLPELDVMDMDYRHRRQPCKWYFPLGSLTLAG